MASPTILSSQSRWRRRTRAHRVREPRHNHKATAVPCLREASAARHVLEVIHCAARDFRGLRVAQYAKGSGNLVSFSINSTKHTVRTQPTPQLIMGHMQPTPACICRHQVAAHVFFLLGARSLTFHCTTKEPHLPFTRTTPIDGTSSCRKLSNVSHTSAGRSETFKNGAAVCAVELFLRKGSSQISLVAQPILKGGAFGGHYPISTSALRAYDFVPHLLMEK